MADGRTGRKETFRQIRPDHTNRPPTIHFRSGEKAALTQVQSVHHDGLFSVADEDDARGGPVLVFERPDADGFEADFPGGIGQAHEGPAVGQPDLAPVAGLPPRLVAEPGALLDVEHVGADRGNALEKGGVEPLDRRAHQGDRDDADYDTQRREAGAHLVGANRVPGDGEAFAKFSKKIHRAGGQRRAGVSHAQRALVRERESKSGVGFANGGRRDARPTFRDSLESRLQPVQAVRAA